MWSLREGPARVFEPESTRPTSAGGVLLGFAPPIHDLGGDWNTAGSGKMGRIHAPS